MTTRNGPILICTSLMVAVITIVFLSGCVNPPAQDTIKDTVFTEKHNGTSVDAKAGELVTIRLEENPTTGYSWNMSFTDGLEVVKDEFISSGEEGIVGAGGVHEWIIKADRTGQHKISAIYKRPWESLTGEEGTFNLTLNVSP